MRLLQSTLYDAPVTLLNQDMDLRYTWIHTLNNQSPLNDQILGKRDADILDRPEDALLIEMIKQSVLDTGEALRRELILYLLATPYTFDMTVTPLLNVDEQIVGITSIMIDITDRQRNEQYRFAETLGRMAIILNSSLELDSVLHTTLISVAHIVPFDSGDIMLKEGNEIWVAYRYQEVMSPEKTIIQLEDYPHLQHMCAHEQLILIDYLPSQKDFRSYLGIPLIIDNKVIGFLNLYSAENAHFNRKQARQLRALCAQAALAIRNAQLYERAQELAATEERQRLARDLHDAVSQSLYASRILAETLPHLLDKDHEVIKKHLERLRLLNHSASSEMRLLLQELHPPQQTEVRLTTRIDQLADALRGRKAVNVVVEILIDEAEIPPEVKLPLFRIAQEAFNNIAKHSQAQNARLTLQETSVGIQLIVRDDGIGFELDDVEATSLGLRSMQERAEKLKAVFRIFSHPNEGTVLAVHWKRS